MEEKIKKFKRIFNTSLWSSAVLYITVLIIISFLSEKLDKGGFFKFNFPFYLLIYTLMTAPFVISAYGATFLIKEIILYKRYGTPKKRLVLLALAYSIFVSVGISVFVGLYFSTIDIMIFFIIPLVVCSIILIIFALKNKK